MTHTQSSVIAIALAALLVGPAMAANTDGTLTREQVKAELNEAIRTGNMVYGESGDRLNELYPYNYPAIHHVDATREQVRAELAEAIRTGNMVYDENGARLNELYPNNYPEQHHAAVKTREQVNAELTEARKNGTVDRPVAA